MNFTHIKLSFLLFLQNLFLTQSSKNHGDNHIIEPEVIIIGAGASGIAAAQVFHEANISFMLIEASDEIGGRVQNHKFGQYAVENGANWIQGTTSKDGISNDNPLWKFKNEYNMKGSVTDWDDYSMMITSGEEVDYDIVDKWWDKFQDATDSCLQKGLTLLEKSKKNRKQNSEDISVEDCFNKRGYGPNYKSESDRMIGEALKYFDIEADDTIPTSNKSLMFWAYEQNNVNKYNEDFYMITDSRGYKIFLKEIAKPFMEFIRFNHEVVAIKHNSNGLTIQIGENNMSTHESVKEVLGGPREFNAKYVISTLPLGVLQKGDVKFTPSLSKKKMEAIRKMKMGNYAKVYLQFPYDFWGDFWTEEILMILDDSNNGYKSLAFNLNHPKYFPGSNMITFHFVGDDAVKIETQEREKTKSDLMQLLRDAFTGSVPKPIRMHVTNWTHNPFSYGSYSAIPVGFTSDMWEELRKNVGRLYFSGEHTAEKYHGFVHGAFETGKSTANKVLREINGAHLRKSALGKDASKDLLMEMDNASLASSFVFKLSDCFLVFLLSFLLHLQIS